MSIIKLPKFNSSIIDGLNRGEIIGIIFKRPRRCLPLLTLLSAVTIALSVVTYVGGKFK